MKHEWKNSSLLQKIVHRHHVNWKQKKRERNPSSRSAHSLSYCPIWNIPGKEVSPVFYFLHFVFVSLILSWIWWVNAHTIWLANFLNVGCHWSISYDLIIHVKSTLPCSLIFFSLNETKTPSQVAHKQTLVNAMELLFTFCLLFFWILTCWGIYYHFPLVSESSKKKKERKQFTTTSCYKNIRREQLAISVAPPHMFPLRFNYITSVLPRNPCPVPSIYRALKI